MTIAAHDWLALSELLDTVLAMPMEERAAWIEGLGGDRAALKTVLRELLERKDLLETGGFLATLPKVGDRPTSIRADATAGDLVGPYRLERTLGVGGMGSVWLAERADGLLKRRVALKIPHFSGSLGELAERMVRERNILAALEHPNIARLYDAGLTATGTPYLALEYVEGEPIDVFCRTRAIDIPGRIDLLQQVARAVAYAHAHLVVHRDLKPSNIMVDPDGNVRLLDFGIAKILDPTATAKSAITQFVGAALTPEYASPEQVRGGHVSTASDVYSLGVVAYELLSGARPYKLGKERDALQLAQAIAAAEPMHPSEAAGDPLLRRRLRGDLDTILLKALKKLPEERYATVGEFADDLRRYVRREPVRARPDSLGYRTGKFIRRNKIAVGAGSAVVAALSIGLVLTLWQARLLRAEERTSRAVEQFLESIFRTNSNEQPNPVQARQTNVRELLRRGAQTVDESLKDAPESRLRVLSTLAQMHNDLDLYEEAVALNRKRVALAQSLYGRDDLRVIDALIDLANAMQESKSNGERGAVLDQALAILDRRGDKTSIRRGRVLGELSSVYQELDIPKALAFAAESVKVLRAYPLSVPLSGSLLMQGYLLAAMRRYPEAEPVLAQAAEVSKATQGKANPELIRLYGTLADVRYFREEYASAEASFSEAWHLAQAQLGDSSVETALAEARLGQFLTKTSRIEQGIEHTAHARESMRRILIEDDSFYIPTVELYHGRALSKGGHAADAVKFLSHSLEILRKYRPESSGLQIASEDLAQALVDTGDFDEVEHLIEQARQIGKHTGASASNLNGVTVRVALLLARSDPEGAALALEQLALSPEESTLGSPSSMSAMLLKAEVEIELGRAESGERLATAVAKLIAVNPRRAYLKYFEARAMLLAGTAVHLRGEDARAEPLLRQSVELHAALYNPKSNPALADSMIALGSCLVDLGRFDEARGLEAQARAILDANEQLGPQYRRPLLILHKQLSDHGSRES